MNSLWQSYLLHEAHYSYLHHRILRQLVEYYLSTVTQHSPSVAVFRLTVIVNSAAGTPSREKRFYLECEEQSYVLEKKNLSSCDLCMIHAPQRYIQYTSHAHLMWKESLCCGPHGRVHFQSFLRWALCLKPHGNNTINTLTWILLLLLLLL